MADNVNTPKSEPKPMPSLVGRTMVPVLIGSFLAVVFFGGFIGWAGSAPLSAAAISPGVISPSGSRRVVQHLEGGIVSDILVRDGDQVEEGEILLILEETQARASVDANESQFWRFTATVARIQALQSRADEVVFDVGILAHAEEVPSFAMFLDNQRRLFQSTQEAHAGQRDILTQQIGQLEQEIAGREEEIVGIKRQLDLIAEEIVDVQTLLARDLARKPRLLELQREEARLGTIRASARSAIAQARQRIGEIELTILNAEAEFDQTLARERSETDQRLAEYQERVTASRDVLERTEIRAPVAGTVVQMQVKTIGGVIGAGEPLLDIVPSNVDLVIDARVSPIDIDVVHLGLTAQVHLLPYVQRYTAPLEGVVTRIGADALIDEQTGERYFSTEVSVDRAQLEGLSSDIELVPGMPADVFIVTGERTVIGYFVEPIVKSFRRSLREP
ncbi:MAG: HlyD family type I secretion periplasmic adaptor subunit [Pseudomonadota bacterium]